MIRTAEAKDAEAVLRLAKEFATSFVVEEECFHATFSKLLAATDVYLGIAEEDGEVIGYVLAFEHSAFFANGLVTWVEEIMVSPDRRRRSVGRSLMTQAENWSRSRGSKLIALATRRAADFYRAIGFEESASYFRKIL